MALMNQLPNELLAIIFSHLEYNRGALLALARMSRTLRPTAQAYLFRNATGLDSVQLELFERSIRYNPVLATLVHRFGPVMISMPQQVVLYGSAQLLKRLGKLEGLQVQLCRYHVGHRPVQKFLTLPLLATLKEIALVVQEDESSIRQRSTSSIDCGLLCGLMCLPTLREFTMIEGSRLLPPGDVERSWSQQRGCIILLPRAPEPSVVSRIDSSARNTYLGPFWIWADSLAHRTCLRVVHVLHTSHRYNDPTQLEGLDGSLGKLCGTLEELVLLVSSDLRNVSGNGASWPVIDLSQHGKLKRVHTHGVFFCGSSSGTMVPGPAQFYGRLPSGLETLWIELANIPHKLSKVDAHRLPRANDVLFDSWLPFFDSPSDYGLHTLKEVTLKDAVKVSGTMQFFDRRVCTFTPGSGYEMERKDESFQVGFWRYWDRTLGPWSDWSRGE
ncbi:hypothetical protein K491DRAFT_720763 [Lophiostoma macrostomum CBS 122681]|uniref:F-box domain-containing protein n=1 Tax=Lophiostoma macrostomum CBS 122681 TaxID=1314788 RepID=A0A6A6SSA0_9PLEO|nr:hypothetical protein K491DRAFT_720763 [Lophiostoma macrostomum CBS 122681]